MMEKSRRERLIVLDLQPPTLFQALSAKPSARFADGLDSTF